MNNTIKQDMLKIDGISEFSLDDFNLFEKYIQKESIIMYSDSWLYTLRSARDNFGDLCFKYCDTDLLFTVAFRYNKVYIGKIFGLNTKLVPRIIEILEKLHTATGLQIILKKVPEKYFQLFLTYDYFHRNNSFEVECEKELEDECFPEKLVSLKKIFKVKKGQVYIAPKRFRHGVNRFENMKVSIREENPLDGEFNLQKQLYALSEVARGNKNKYFAYKSMLEYISELTKKNKNYIVRVYYSNGHVEGYYILQKLSDKVIGFYCGLTSIRYGGITEYLDSLIFKELLDEGYEKILLGGSEKIGVARYVEKLNPLNPTYTVYPLFYK